MNESSDGRPKRLKHIRRFFTILKEILLYWNRDSNFLINVFWMLLRWIFATWLLILSMTTLALIVTFFIDPSAFKDPTDRKQECVTIERSDGTAFDSCDLLVP